MSELLTGQLLSEVLATHGPLPLAEAVEICLQAAAGLQASHQLGVAHGRVSPHTILITPADDDRPLVKLIGFDFSWYLVDSGHSLDQGPNDRYSSPERHAGSAPDEVSDVFSLGAVLHHLLVGKPPTEGPVPDSIPPALRRVMGRTLASPDQRYPTVAAFAEALAGTATSPSKQERIGRWRSGWLAASIVLLFVAASMLWGWDRIRPNLDGSSHRQKPRAGAPESLAVSPQPPSPAKSADATKQGRQPDETGVISGSKPSDSAAGGPSRASERRDSAAGPYISPFRRAHPWAAHPNGRSYFPSSCPLALASSELIYFKSEKEARATGRSRSKVPGCT